MTVVLFFVACSKDDDIIDGDNQEQGAIKVNNNGHDYIDLGLSAYWATCNIGTYTSTNQGNKYAFGETTTKNTSTLVPTILVVVRTLPNRIWVEIGACQQRVSLKNL